MVATTAASLGGANLYVPGPMRSIMVAIIGVLLGASFTPEIVEKAHEWPLTIGCLLLYLGFLIGILFLYFHRIVGLDPATAYFSAAPGGLSEMVITGAAMGADDRTIALIHTARVLLVVLAVPLWFRYTTGVTTTAVRDRAVNRRDRTHRHRGADDMRDRRCGRGPAHPAAGIPALGTVARERLRTRCRHQRIRSALGAGRSSAGGRRLGDRTRSANRSTARDRSSPKAPRPSRRSRPA